MRAQGVRSLCWISLVSQFCSKDICISALCAYMLHAKFLVQEIVKNRLKRKKLLIDCAVSVHVINQQPLIKPQVISREILLQTPLDIKPLSCQKGTPPS